jgi:hypothetical protein
MTQTVTLRQGGGLMRTLSGGFSRRSAYVDSRKYSRCSGNHGSDVSSSSSRMQVHRGLLLLHLMVQ